MQSNIGNSKKENFNNLLKMMKDLNRKYYNYMLKRKRIKINDYINLLM